MQTPWDNSCYIITLIKRTVRLVDLFSTKTVVTGMARCLHVKLNLLNIFVSSGGSILASVYSFGYNALGSFHTLVLE